MEKNDDPPTDNYDISEVLGALHHSSLLPLKLCRVPYVWAEATQQGEWQKTGTGAITRGEVSLKENNMQPWDQGGVMYCSHNICTTKSSGGIL